MRRYDRTPRSADALGVLPSLGLVAGRGAIDSLGIVPNAGRFNLQELFAWTVEDGVTSGTFARTSNATFTTV